jgi:hypothetical protein
MRTKLIACAILLTFGLVVDLKAGEESIAEKVNSIVEKVDQRAITVAEAETNCLKLLEAAGDAADKGKVYRELVTILADHDPKNELAPKTAEYCEQALKFPQSVKDSCNLYATWSGALEGEYWAKLYWTNKLADSVQSSRIRRLIIKPCLEGLAIIATNEIPEEKPLHQTAVQMIWVPAPEEDDRARDLVKQNKEQMKARAREDYEAEMIDIRNPLTEIIRRLYADHQSNLEEVKEEASRIFPNSKDVDALIEKVKVKK